MLQKINLEIIVNVCSSMYINLYKTHCITYTTEVYNRQVFVRMRGRIGRRLFLNRCRAERGNI